MVEWCNDMTEDRPNPDALLAEVQQQESRKNRGKLKVFFGMSAGVGKTYAMLEEARKRASEGADVLIGYAEPHIRPETESLLLGMEILPYRIIEHRGAKLKELDLDAAIARKPAVLCVDELAHTNAPGMRHPKRWQDVAELLDAGIHVYTTLNVQHLESVNDLVQRITGVRVRETLPDVVLEQADEVELVDIAPNELLERFREGKIYRPEQAERASKHFFTTGNLIALRELALRKTAERVDAQMLDYRRDERVKGIIPASERVLVCVGPSPLSARLVRSAKRLATGMRAKLIAVYVEKPSRFTEANRRRTEQNLKLAEELGAQVVTLSGTNVADELLAFAVSRNVTKIVVGKPIRSRLRDFVFGSMVDDLIRRSGDIDIYVIRGDASGEEAAEPVDQPKAGPADWRGYLSAVLVIGITTALGWPLYHRLEIENENILMLFLLGVMWISAHYSRGAAVLASVLAVGVFDLVFVPPHYTFAVTDRQYVVVFVVMLLTALVISALTQRVRAQGEAARQRERRTSAMLALAGELAVTRTIEQALSATVRNVVEVLGGKCGLLLPDGDQKLHLRADSSPEGLQELNDHEMGVAQWAFEHLQSAGRGTSTLPAAKGRYIPLIDSRGGAGVLGVFPGDGDGEWSSEQRHLVEAFGSQAALAIERVALADEARKAWERVEAEFLRNTLLSGVSHELRTPLAGITGAASTLTETGEQISPETRREMLETIHSEAEHMDRLVNNLLDMTRMEAGGLSLKKEWLPIQEVVGSALHHLRRRLQGRDVVTRVPNDLPLAHLDGVAIEQVIVNLLDNAVEYTPPETPLEVVASRDGDQIVLSISDHGPGLPEGTEKRIFEKFFRARPDRKATHRGIGLGLAICRGIIEAHGGWISAANRDGGGAVFRFGLPIGGVPPTVDASG